MENENKIVERIARLEQENINQNLSRAELVKSVKEIKNEVDEIKEKLLGRPSWLVMAFISILVALCSFLATYVFTKL